MTIEPQRPPIPFRPPRPADLYFNAAYELLVAHWGPTKTRRHHAAVALLRALCTRPQFLLGRRVAWSIVDVAEALDRRHVRTIYRVVAQLRELPGLIRITQVLPGEPDWKGARTWFGHIEWQAGPDWRSRVAAVDSRVSVTPPAGVAPAPPLAWRQPPPGVAPPDLGLDLHLDLELQLNREPASVATTDRLNFEAAPPSANPPPFPPAADNPATHPSPTDHPLPEAAKASSAPAAVTLERNASESDRGPSEPNPLVPEPPQPWRPRGAVRPVPALAGVLGPRSALAPAPSSRQPFAPRRLERPATAAPTATLEHSELAEAVIRQHRQLADPKSPFVPISADERLLVDQALRWLTWCRTDQEKLDLCARVSELAARKAGEKGNPANLTYTFGGLEGQPHKFFLERVALLRERDEQLSKELHAAELASALFGSPPPVCEVRPGPPRPPRPAPAPPIRKRPTTIVPPTRTSPLPPHETLARVAAALARMNEPYMARAG